MQLRVLQRLMAVMRRCHRPEILCDPIDPPQFETRKVSPAREEPQIFSFEEPSSRADSLGYVQSWSAWNYQKTRLTEAQSACRDS